MKTIKHISLTLLVGAVSLVLFSFLPGKDFTGTIVYNITYNQKDMDPQMAAYLPKTMKMIIKAPMSRTEISMGMGSNISIFNSDDKTGVNLMDMMGQKLAVRMTAEDVGEELNAVGEVDVEYTNETKEIVGYECKKAIVNLKQGGGQELIVYYTEELSTGIENDNNPFFKDIDGLMLEFSMEQNGMEMYFTAVTIDQGKVSDKLFEVPDGYEEITEEEMEKRFGM